jgi:hypothetical protein
MKDFGVCQSNTSSPQNALFEHDPFRDVKKVLSLADGFGNPKYDSLAYSVQANVNSSVSICAADFDLPSGYPKREGNVQFKQVDHKKPLKNQLDEFKDNVDTVVMNRGLCICREGYESCAGIDFTNTNSVEFFEQVAELLNQQNPHSIAFLQGMHHHHTTAREKSFEEAEKYAEAKMEKTLESLEGKFPHLDFKMVYYLEPTQLLAFQKWIDAGTKNNIAAILSSTIPRDELTPVFRGIVIQMKSLIASTFSKQ